MVTGESEPKIKKR